jgi:hypothetical protein
MKIVSTSLRKRKLVRACGSDSIFSVELPGIEPVALPELLLAELPVRPDSVQFSTTRYLRFRSRALTAQEHQPLLS